MAGYLVRGSRLPSSQTTLTPSPRRSARPAWSDVVQVRLVPIPEGPVLPPFETVPSPANEHRLAEIQRWAPSYLPAPLDQGACDIGGDMVVTLAGGQQI